MADGPLAYGSLYSSLPAVALWHIVRAFSYKASAGSEPSAIERVERARHTPLMKLCSRASADSRGSFVFPPLVAAAGRGAETPVPYA